MALLHDHLHDRSGHPRTSFAASGRGPLRGRLPYHHDLVCDAPIKDGGQACPWHTRGHQAAIWPTLTDTDLAAAALSGHPDLFTRPEPEENR